MRVMVPILNRWRRFQICQISIMDPSKLCTNFVSFRSSETNGLLIRGAVASLKNGSRKWRGSKSTIRVQITTGTNSKGDDQDAVPKKHCSMQSMPSDPELNRGHRRPGSKCKTEIQSSSLNQNLKGQWPSVPACSLGISFVLMPRQYPKHKQPPRVQPKSPASPRRE